MNPKLRFEPGTRSSYSNLGTLLLGSAIAHVTGDPFPAVLEREVLTPVGMRATGFAYPDGVGAATGYHPRWSRCGRCSRGGSWASPPVAGSASGGSCWTARRTAAWSEPPTTRRASSACTCATASSTARGSISAGAAAEMRDIRMRGKRYDLGLGWFRPADRRDADPPFVEHLGGGAGFFNVMRLYPTVGVGAVVMGNATKYDVDAVAALALA